MCHNRDTIFNLSIDQSIYRLIDFRQVLKHLPRITCTNSVIYRCFKRITVNTFQAVFSEDV